MTMTIIMKKFISNLRCICLALIVLLTAGQANAALFDAVTVAPGQLTAALGRANSATVTWQITSSSIADINMTLEGVRGEFRTPGNVVLGVVTTPLPTRSLFVQKGTPLATVFTENVLIPAYVLDSARVRGLSQIYYARVFSAHDLTNNITQPGEGLVSIAIGSSSGGALSIGRLALSFENGDVRRVVGRDSRLYAKAALDVQGSGWLHAAWEIAETPTTQGEPVYRLLQPVQQYNTGSQEILLHSPPLPTQDSGIYLVRLRIDIPVPAMALPEIAYAVAEMGAEPVETLKVLSPTGLVRLGAPTWFEWQAIPGAKFYRLEIFTQELRVEHGAVGTKNESEVESGEVVPGKLVTGVVLPGQQLSTTFSSATRQHLQSGQRYFWQVHAIDINGRVTAISARGEIIGE